MNLSNKKKDFVFYCVHYSSNLLITGIDKYELLEDAGNARGKAILCKMGNGKKAIVDIDTPCKCYTTLEKAFRAAEIHNDDRRIEVIKAQTSVYESATSFPEGKNIQVSM